MQLHAYYCLFQYLQWLPITFLIKYKLLTLAFKAPQPTLPVWCSTISLVKSCFSQTGATYCSLRVTTHSYLSAFAHAIPAALTSQPVETFFNFPSSLKVQSWNLTKLCNANGTLVSSFYCGYSSIYLMPISYPHPNPQTDQMQYLWVHGPVTPTAPWPLPLQGLIHGAQPTVGTFCCLYLEQFMLLIRLRSHETQVL